MGKETHFIENLKRINQSEKLCNEHPNWKFQYNWLLKLKKYGKTLESLLPKSFKLDKCGLIKKKDK